MNFETQRLRVRPSQQADEQAIKRLLTDEKVMQYLGGPKRNPDTSLWQVAESKDNHFLGCCRLWRPGLDPSVCEITLILSPERQGHGIGPELFNGLKKYARISFAAKLLIGVVHKDNEPCIKMLRKVKMSPCDYEYGEYRLG